MPPQTHLKIAHDATRRGLDRPSAAAKAGRGVLHAPRPDAPIAAQRGAASEKDAAGPPGVAVPERDVVRTGAPRSQDGRSEGDGCCSRSSAPAAENVCHLRAMVGTRPSRASARQSRVACGSGRLRCMRNDGEGAARPLCTWLGRSRLCADVGSVRNISRCAHRRAHELHALISRDVRANCKS